MLAAFLYPLFLLCFVIMEIELVRQMNSQRDPFYLLAILPTLGFIWDTAVISLGIFLQAGPLLQSLNWGRYLAHGLLSPLFYVFAIGLMRQSGLSQAGRPVQIIFGGIAALFIIAGVAAASNLHLQPVQALGVLRYVEAKEITPAWARMEPLIASILLMVLFLIAGAVLWKRTKWAWLFLGSVAAFMANAIPGNARFILSSLGEVLWLLAIVTTAHHFWKPKAESLRVQKPAGKLLPQK